MMFDECRHGESRRWCEICKRDDEITRLEDRVKELEEELPPSEGHDFDSLYPPDDDDRLLNPAGARREIVGLRDKLAEKDARIAELERDCCVLDNIISHAAATLNDGMLSYEEASEKALDELNRVPQLKSDRLYVELGEKDKRIEEAEALINYAALEIMTTDQLGRWAGVRAWIEDV